MLLLLFRKKKNGLYVIDDGKEIVFDDFEILIYSKNLLWKDIYNNIV